VSGTRQAAAAATNLTDDPAIARLRNGLHETQGNRVPIFLRPLCKCWTEFDMLARGERCAAKIFGIHRR